MNKIKTKNRRAFTLMELLIVVIVIGVLAAVTLPKFNRVIENRKVTEAEEMMSAVRTEQERRCSLDKNYTTNFDNLKDIIASNNTKNYTYSLQPQGISAQSNSSGYTLKILSYEDGSYCCEGEGCKKLNKNYPDCSTLSFPESVCIGEENDGGGLGEDPTRKPEVKECTTPAPASSETCSPCGETRTRTVTCVDGEWEVGAWSASCKTQEQCPITCPEPAPDRTEECPCGEIRTRSVTCGADGQWVIGEWDKECATECGNTCDNLFEQDGEYCRNNVANLVIHPEYGNADAFDGQKITTEWNGVLDKPYVYSNPMECCCPACPAGQGLTTTTTHCECKDICDDPKKLNPITNTCCKGDYNPTTQKCCAVNETYDSATGECQTNPWQLYSSNSGYVYKGFNTNSSDKKVYYQVTEGYALLLKSTADESIIRNWGKAGQATWASGGCQYNMNKDSYAELKTVCPESNPCTQCDPNAETCMEDYVCYKKAELDAVDLPGGSPYCTQLFDSTTLRSPSVTAGYDILGYSTNGGVGYWMKANKDNQYASINSSQIGGGMRTDITWSGIRYKTICPNDCNGDAVKQVSCDGAQNVSVCVRAPMRSIKLYRCMKITN